MQGGAGHEPMRQAHLRRTTFTIIVLPQGSRCSGFTVTARFELELDPFVSSTDLSLNHIIVRLHILSPTPAKQRHRTRSCTIYPSKSPRAPPGFEPDCGDCAAGVLGLEAEAGAPQSP
jgi:hypothetical protein